MCCNSTSYGRRNSPPPAGSPISIPFARPSMISFPPPCRPTGGTAPCTRCPGSLTSACCSGGPISCRVRLRDLADLAQLAAQASAERQIPFGFVWQGARYEGLVTVFLEHLGAFGGRILDDAGRVVVDSEAAEQALTYMRDAIHCRSLRASSGAHVAGRAVALRVSERPGGVHAQLALRLCAAAGRIAIAGCRPLCRDVDAWCRRRCANRRAGRISAGHQRTSDQPDDAYRLIAYLLQPEQMIERAQIAGQFPTRPALYRHRRTGRRPDDPGRPMRWPSSNGRYLAR